VKIGRNDPCPWGSGKKYKKCHEDSDRASERLRRAARSGVNIDLVAARLGQVADEMEGFAAAVESPADELRSRLLDQIGAGLDGQAAAEALDGYLAEVEAEIRTRIEAHSVIYWLHLTRRLPPDPIGDSSEWTVILYRRILDLAVLKFARSEVDDPDLVKVDVGGATRVVPRELSDSDVVGVHVIEYLAYEYNAAATAFRRVGKGATLRVADGDFHTPAAEEAEELMQMLDRRVAEFGSLSGGFGAIVDVDLSEDKEDPHEVVMAVRTNAERHPPDSLEKVSGMQVPGPTNFVPEFFGIGELREALLPFDSEIAGAFGARLDTLLAAIWGTSMHLLRVLREAPESTLQIFRTGYLLISGEYWKDFESEIAGFTGTWWKRHLEQDLKEDEAMALAGEALGALTCSAPDREAISLWDRLPHRLFVVGEDFTLIDYSAYTTLIAGLFREVGYVGGALGNIRGDSFEEAVATRMEKAGLQPWQRGKLTGPDGSKRDLDTSFVAGDTLFLIESKALSQKERVGRGDYAALQDRRKTLEGYLGQVESLAAFLSENPRVATTIYRRR
jgi:hypothetical protein